MSTPHGKEPRDISQNRFLVTPILAPETRIINDEQEPYPQNGAFGKQ